MTHYEEFLGPSARWRPLLERGVVAINRDANRLVWTRDGRFAARLVPSTNLSKRMAELPPVVEKAAEYVQEAWDLREIAPALEVVQLVSSVGALASVAGLAVSVAGFAAVLHTLSRMEGKLDQLLGKINDLHVSMAQLGVTTESFLLARLESAHQHLDRSLSASSERERVELARNARRLFQESRLRYLALWKHADPWMAPTIPIATARELQGRYVACAVGEIQAELVLGDRGAFAHTVETVVADVKNTMALDVDKAFRRRSDALVAEAGREPVRQSLAIAGELPELASDLKIAAQGNTETVRRLFAANEDIELPTLLGIPAHEVLRAIRDAPGLDVYALGLR